MKLCELCVSVLKRNKKINSVIASLFLLFLSCQIPVNQIHIEGFAQGTYYNIRYYDPENRNLKKEIDSLLSEFNKTASIYDETSIVSRINRNEDNVLLNDDFRQLIIFSQQISEQTNGAFDITVGQLVNAWGFGTEKQQDMTQEKIDSLLHCIGYNKIALKDGKLVKQNPCIKLDFNAIAKGYAVDKIGLFFDSLQIDNYLIDIGGEVLAKGNKNGKSWTVGIEKPTNTKDDNRQVLTSIPLDNKSLATSGSYRKYYEKDGVRFAHTISPNTGYPVDNNLLSVTVLHSKTALADGYATAFMVMGMNATIEFLNTHKNIEVYFIYQQADSLFTYATEGFFEK